MNIELFCMVAGTEMSNYTSVMFVVVHVVEEEDLNIRLTLI